MRWMKHCFSWRLWKKLANKWFHRQSWQSKQRYKSYPTVPAPFIWKCKVETQLLELEGTLQIILPRLFFLQWGGWYINSKFSMEHIAYTTENTQKILLLAYSSSIPLSSFFTEACSDVCLLGNVTLLPSHTSLSWVRGIESSWLAFQRLGVGMWPSSGQWDLRRGLLKAFWERFSCF